MKVIHKKAEFIFEIFSATALRIFASPYTFILAAITVIFYLASTPFGTQSFHNSIYDIILCFTFLGFFIIQKTFNKFNTAINLKINELLSSHEHASNRMVNIENKTEAELNDLSKHFTEMGEESERTGALHTTQSIEHKLDKAKQEEDDNEVNSQRTE